MHALPDNLGRLVDEFLVGLVDHCRRLFVSNGGDAGVSACICVFALNFLGQLTDKLGCTAEVVFADSHAVAEYRLHLGFEHGGVERLRDIVVGAAVQSVDGVVLADLCGKQYYRDERCSLVPLYPPAELVALHSRHHHVGDDNVAGG